MKLLSAQNRLQAGKGAADAKATEFNLDARDLSRDLQPRDLQPEPGLDATQLRAGNEGISLAFRFRHRGAAHADASGRLVPCPCQRAPVSSRAYPVRRSPATDGTGPRRPAAECELRRRIPLHPG